ncbi:hypothetical protein BDZ97DRAFT_1759719 [Flammula alnicola]|nr:hypothetical protein BDZ97DRAFT_1759719 [Flammula alnicola]
MTQLQLVDLDKTQKKNITKNHKIQGQVRYHQIQKFKEILDTHAPGYVSMVLWELFAKKVALVSEKNAKYSTELFPQKEITELLLDHLDSCWTPSELLVLLFHYKTSGLQGLHMESPEFVRTPSGLLVESSIKFGRAVSQKTAHMDSTWTTPLCRSPSGVHQE